jgi:hypothetical protein
LPVLQPDEHKKRSFLKKIEPNGSIDLDGVAKMPYSRGLFDDSEKNQRRIVWHVLPLKIV